uniref:Uncharacterized protein n=1 Tax=Siphoviridae sp. ctSA812 TaxID=2825508 RepID=A0A8S5U3G0_9CAUD|nr:MAG TPA: hypothetical protein [Siphoviridae sp. ctSA812]
MRSPFSGRYPKGHNLHNSCRFYGRIFVYIMARNNLI